jgi:hypothetical protein
VNDTLDPDPDYTMSMFALIRDTGPTARVIVRLKAMDRTTGALSTLLTLDSDLRDSDADDQYRRMGTFGIPDPHRKGFQFGLYAYFIEADLIKTSAAGNPGIKLLGIEKDGS